MGALCSWTQLIELESCGRGSGGWGVYGDHGLHDNQCFMVNVSYHVGGDDPGCVKFILIFFCRFLVPLQGTIDRWSWVYLTLTIVQNPHAHCANPENHYVLEHVGYTNLAHCAQWGRCLCRTVCCLLLRPCGRSSTKENCYLQDKRKHPKLIWNIVSLLHKWREQDLHKASLCSTIAK